MAPLWVGVAAALALAVVWVLATAATGLTFHFHPLIVAGAPSLVGRLLADRPLERGEAALGALAGLAAVAIGWLLLGAAAERPTATFVGSQPGGVEGEVLLFAVAGAAAAFAWALRSGGERRG